MLTCANKFIITFAQKGLTLLHLTVLISVVYLSYNSHSSEIISEISSSINNAITPETHELLPFVIEQPLHVLFILISMILYSFIVYFWLLLFSINAHLSVLMHSSNERDKGSSYPSNVMRL